MNIAQQIESAVSPRRSPRLVYVTTIALTQLAFLRGQNEFLARHGFELHAVASPGPELQRLGARDGIATHPIRITRALTPVRDCIALMRLYWLLRALKPDILHVSTPKAALLGALAGWAAQVPVRIYFVRGLVTEAAAGYRRDLYRWLERLTAALCHSTICVSWSLLDFARREGIAGPTATVLANGMSNGLDTSRFEANHRLHDGNMPNESYGLQEGTSPFSVVIGYVGRLVRDKGIEDLAAAWHLLRNEFPACRLLLVGNWEEEDPIDSSWRARLETDDRVELAGAVSDVLPYYRRMSVFVYPSLGSEGLPNAPVEAAAMALPVVATRVVGCVDAVLDGVTGTLVDKGDVRALTAALRKYVLDGALRARHGATGRERVLREFRQDTIWTATYAQYVSFLREKGLPLPSVAVAKVPEQARLDLETMSVRSSA